MFCPLAVDYGNVADWVAGIGSVAAVTAAVWIARGQERFARHQRQIAKNEEHEKRGHLIAEIMRLSSEIEAKAAEIKAQVSMGVGMGWQSGYEELEALRAQALSIQPLAANDPQVFGEVGRIYRESKADITIHTSTPAHIAIVMGKVADKMAQRRSLLHTLLSKQGAVSGL